MTRDSLVVTVERCIELPSTKTRHMVISEFSACANNNKHSLLHRFLSATLPFLTLKVISTIDYVMKMILGTSNFKQRATRIYLS